jgi:hypothetical protein
MTVERSPQLDYEKADGMVKDSVSAASLVFKCEAFPWKMPLSLSKLTKVMLDQPPLYRF